MSLQSENNFNRKFMHCKKYLRINPSNNRGAKHFLCHWRFNPLRIFHLPTRDISLNVSIDPKICLMFSMQIPVWNWINPNLPVDVPVAFGFDSQYLSIHPIWRTEWSQPTRGLILKKYLPSPPPYPHKTPLEIKFQLIIRKYNFQKINSNNHCYQTIHIKTWEKTQY